MESETGFAEILSWHEQYLKNDIMPFWTKHCIDWAHGGINNIVDDDGTVRSTDKFMWSQGRALWTFSALYNRFDHDPQWLAVASNIAQFIMTHGRDEQGAWAFKVHQDGRVAIPAQSIYVDAFIMMGLTEYYLACGSIESLSLALAIFDKTSQRLDDHDQLMTEPHKIPRGYQSHGPLMIFAHAYHELGKIIKDKRLLSRALELAEQIMTQHLDTNTLDFREYVSPGGGFIDTDVGNTFLSGHILESMWFLERIYAYHGRADRIRLTMDVIKKYIAEGWDLEYGGLFLACHAKQGEPVWHQPDAKVWWPATEALYALLRAHRVTGESWCMAWYWKVYEYTYHVFPDKEHGEWHQYFDRKGHKIASVVQGLQVKDPFHLPRSLIYSITELRNMKEVIDT
jgi:N-acylglucosamine 2-epimerase